MNNLFVAITSAFVGALVAFLLAVFREYYADLCRRKSELTSLVYTLHPLSRSLWEYFQTLIKASHENFFIHKIVKKENSLPQNSVAPLKDIYIDHFDFSFICLDGNAVLYDEIKYLTASLHELPELSDFYHHNPSSYNQQYFISNGYKCIYEMIDMANVFNQYYKLCYGAQILSEIELESLQHLKTQIERYLCDTIQENLQKMQHIVENNTLEPSLKSAFMTLFETSKGWVQVIQKLQTDPAQASCNLLRELRMNHFTLFRAFQRDLEQIDAMNQQKALKESDSDIAYEIWKLCSITKLQLNICRKLGWKENGLKNILNSIQKPHKIKLWIRKTLVHQSSYFSWSEQDSDQDVSHLLEK